MDEDQKITPIGKCMSLLPVDPIYAKLILTAITIKEFQGIISEICAIVSMLNCQHVFYTKTTVFSL